MVDPKLPSSVGTVVGGKTAMKSKTRRRTNSDGGTEEKKRKTEFECRFCLMKFEKPQSLGGHMNTHRQERNGERYRRAQQLVSSVAQQQQRQQHRQQQQLPPTWTLPAATEMTVSPSAPGGARGAFSCSSGQFAGGLIQQQFPGPSFSFASYHAAAPASYLAAAPASFYHPPVPSPQSSNSSSYDNLQSLHWGMGGGFPTPPAPRSAPQSGIFQAMATTSTFLQFPSELLRSTVQSSVTHNDSSLVHPYTLSSTAQCPCDLNSPFPSSFPGGL